jgi:hypothetical protein
MKFFKFLHVLFPISLTAFCQSSSERIPPPPLPPPRALERVVEPPPYPYTVTPANKVEAGKVLATIIDIIKGSPLFSDIAYEVEQIEDGFSIHTALSKFTKNVPTSKMPGMPMRQVEVLGPSQNGFNLTVNFRGYGTPLPQGSSGIEHEPYGYSEFMTIRPLSQHFEIAYSYSFGQVHEKPYSSNFKPLPPHDERMKFLHRIIREQLEPIDTGRF